VEWNTHCCLVAVKRSIGRGTREEAQILRTDTGCIYRVNRYERRDAYVAIDAYEKAFQLQNEELATIQSVGAALDTEFTGLVALFLAPLHSNLFHPAEVARSSPCLLILHHQDVKLLYVKQSMRQQHIGRAVAKYLTQSLSVGDRLFIRAPACMTERTVKLWVSVGFVSSSQIIKGKLFKRQKVTEKANIPAGVDTVFLCFIRGGA